MTVVGPLWAYLEAQRATALPPDAVLAAQFGVSRQRVQQVRKALGIPSLRWATCRRGHDYATTGYRSRGTHGRVCAACYPPAQERRRPMLALVCAECGAAFTLTGRRRSAWLRNHRAWPHLRTLCPTCAADRSAIVRRAQALRTKATHCRKGHPVEGPDAQVRLHLVNGYWRRVCRRCEAAWRAGRKGRHMAAKGATG